MRRRAFLALVMALALVVPAGIPAVAAADAPDSCSGVVAASLKNVWLSDGITTGTDVDWFRFVVPAAKRVLVTLGQLPANYRLDLYSDCATKLASSNRGGRQFEEILRRLPAGTYHVKVSSAAGASSPKDYKLKFRTLANKVILLSTKTWLVNNDTGLLVVGELYNNTAQTRKFIKIQVRFYDSANHQIGPTYISYSLIDLMKPRTRSPVGGGYAPIPAGYHHYTLSAAQGTPTDDVPVGNLAIHPGTPYTSGSGVRHYPGTLTNNNVFGVIDPQVVLTLYDSRGRVVNVDWTYPSDIPAGATVDYDCLVWDHYTGVNRYVFDAEAKT